jgi:hypothetical protein
MREQAVKFADDWDNIVVRRLINKKEKLLALMRFFSINNTDYRYITTFFSNHYGNTLHYYNGESTVGNSELVFVVIDILKSLKCDDLADKLNLINDKYEQINQQFKDNKPQENDFFANDKDEMSFNDRIISQKEFELATTKYNKEVSITQFNFCKDFIAFYKILHKNKKVVDFIGSLRAQLRQAKDIESIVHEKSSMVKLAINFGGTNLLKVLQELHEFQKTL